MLKELTILVDDSLTGKRTFTRATVDFERISHVQEDLNLNTLLLDECGDIIFVTSEEYKICSQYLKESRRNYGEDKSPDNRTIA